MARARDTFGALDPGGTGTPVLPYRDTLLERKYPCPAVQGYLTYKKVPLSCLMGVPHLQENTPVMPYTGTLLIRKQP